MIPEVVLKCCYILGYLVIAAKLYINIFGKQLSEEAKNNEKISTRVKLFRYITYYRLGYPSHLFLRIMNIE
jgi:hypothetical protein